MRKISVSLGVFAHNEEINIERLLSSIKNQELEVAFIKEILVVSSGSYDKTNKLIRQFAKKDKRIKFIEELERNGKSSAVNLFLRKAKSQVLITISSDLRLHKETIEEMVLPFLHKDVGMVGGHPKPCNVRKSEIGKEGKLLWELHHLVSLKNPKCGEIVAFRNTINSIPKESSVDEATIEVLLKLIGYKVVYAPRAIVYNKLPKTFADYLWQRRRNYIGHLWLSEKYNYKVSTMNFNNDYEAILNYLWENPKQLIYLTRLVLIEFWARVLGWFDYHIMGKNPFVWKMVKR